jgi:hypothetical protein
MQRMENESDTDFLARMMAEGFASLQSSMESQFDTVHTEIRAINKRLDDFIVPTLDDHARRIKDLELAQN